MKFVKHVSLIISVLALSACATNTVKQLDNKTVSLKDTIQYMPKQTFTELGDLVEYTAMENPYLAVDSRIDKGSVLLFIEAKKAKRNGDLKTAQQKLKVITNKDKSISGPWVMLGDISFENKDLQQAQQDYEHALEINNENVNAYIALARVQRVMGDFNLAQNTLESALALWPDFPEAHLNLGILYDLYLNKSEQGQQHMEAYLFLTQYKNPEVIAWLEEVKSRTGIKESFIEIKVAAKKNVKPANNLEKTKG